MKFRLGESRMTLNVIPLPNLSATEAAAARLAPLLRRGDVLALSGELGAGKTTFARALLHSLGIMEEVPSPTFTLLQTYDAPHFTVNHFDLYRLENETELLELGWDDALSDGVSVIEWPERASRRLPKNLLTLNFKLENGERTLAFGPEGEWVGRMGSFK
jgi:tRNA threonylcarbamoyladenosine biosynthesis protein TsaE